MTEQPQRERVQATLEAETAGSPDIGEASLWSDAWRSLRKNPFFIVGAVLLTVFLLVVDVMWWKVLASRWIGVIRVDENKATQQTESVEQPW